MGPIEFRPAFPPAAMRAAWLRADAPATAAHAPAGGDRVELSDAAMRAVAAPQGAPAAAGAEAAQAQTGGGFLDADRGSGMTPRQVAGLIADIAGIFDPTPISDGVSGAISLSEGDYKGAGLSALSMVPYAGDAIAKPLKFAHRAMEAFPPLAKFASRSGELVQAIKVLGKKALDPSTLNASLKTLSNMAEDAGRAYGKNPRFLEKAKDLRLPTDGPIPFVPPKGWNPRNPLRTQDGKGFVDAYGNEWRKGPSRTPGHDFEWDVVPRSKGGLSNFSRDGSHVNVSLDGVPTHR